MSKLPAEPPLSDPVRSALGFMFRELFEPYLRHAPPQEAVSLEEIVVTWALAEGKKLSARRNLVQEPAAAALALWGFYLEVRKKDLLSIEKGNFEEVEDDLSRASEDSDLRLLLEQLSTQQIMDYLAAILIDALPGLSTEERLVIHGSARATLYHHRRMGLACLREWLKRWH